MQAVPFLIITHYNVFSYIYQRLFVLLSQFFLVSAFLHLAQCARNKALCFFVPNSRYGFNCLRFTRLLVRIYSLHIVLQEKSSITWPPLQKSLWYRKKPYSSPNSMDLSRQIFANVRSSMPPAANTRPSFLYAFPDPCNAWIQSMVNLSIVVTTFLPL